MEGIQPDACRQTLHSYQHQLSLDTLIATSSLLGHELESCQSIRERQDASLAHSLECSSSRRLRNKAQERLFAVAPLDILVSDVGGRKNFHIIELNGTGIGGLTNAPYNVVDAVLSCMGQMATFSPKPSPLIIVGSSGMESESDPRLNKQIYEKVLYAEAIYAGYRQQYGVGQVATMRDAAKRPEILRSGKPTVLVGYMKEFLANLTCVDGHLYIGSRQVDGVVNDRMCLNILHRFNYEVDLSQLLTMNRTYLPGADKGIAYSLLNDYLRAHPNLYFPNHVFFREAASRTELVELVLEQVRSGRQIVIKPRGTGLGHGIEFFLDSKESEEAIVERIDGSLSLTERFYGLAGGALPYTLCEYIDTCTIGARNHAMAGHKYELRVIVYRDGMLLKAFPSIVKISSQAFNPNNIDRMMLINNVTASVTTTKQAAANFKLPLCHWETLDMLGLQRDHLEALCEVATGYVASILDRVQLKPEFLGLPLSDMVVPLAEAYPGGQLLRQFV